MREALTDEEAYKKITPPILVLVAQSNGSRINVTFYNLGDLSLKPELTPQQVETRNESRISCDRAL